MKRYFRVFYESNDGGGTGLAEDEMVSFGEAFGINPDGTEYVAEPEPDPDPTPPTPPAPEPEPQVTPEPTPPGEEPPPEPTLYAGKYKTVEEMEKAYQELQREFSKRQAAPPEPTPEPTPEPAPKPLFKGEVSEITNEAQLYELATSDPEAAAMFAMENHARLNEDQFNTVMNAWIAQQPFKAIQTMHAWQAELMREEFAERGRVQEEAYVNDMRDKAIDAAVAEQPLLAEYADQLGDYIAEHPQLTQMVDGARTVAELSSAIQAIFFMMAGPQLSKQALEAQVAARVNQQTAEEAAAAAAAATQSASSLQRNTAAPPSDEQEYGDALRDMVLNPGKNRR